MDYDSYDVPVSWATMTSDPYNQDPSAQCLPCKTPSYVAPSWHTPAPPPAPGQAPCVQCPNNRTMGMRRTVRDSGPPCCITETYGNEGGYNNQPWPWQWADGSTTPNTGMEPELWQDLYEVKDRAQTGFAFNPIFNPYVL
jgi:hypothetical protein